MQVTHFHTTWHVHSKDELDAVLGGRDRTGGAEYWLGDLPDGYPQMTIRMSGDLCHVMYFPDAEHAGFRLIGGEGLPPHGCTRFVWDGADPAYGEDHPNEFVVSIAKGLEVLKEFLRDSTLPKSGSWFEL